MPLLHKKLSVILFWLTFTQLQLIGRLTDWLTGGWLADWLTDFSAYQLTEQWTGWLVQFLTGWLTDLLTDCVTDRLLDLLATILVTNYCNKTCFSWICWKISHIHSTHLCSHSNVPLSFPNVEPRVLWSTETTVIPKSTLWKRENHTSVSKFVMSIVAHRIIDLTGWLTYWVSC